jgi:hypothetical protein
LPEEKMEREQRIEKNKKILFILFPPCSGNGLRPMLIYNPVQDDFSIQKQTNFKENEKEMSNEKPKN